MISHGRTAGFATGDDPWRMPLMVCRNLVFYLVQLVHPVNLTSSYEIPEPLSPSQPMVLAGIVGTLVLALIVVVSWRRARALAVGVLFYALAIAPTLGVVHFSWVSASDKYVYFPVVGLMLPIAAGLAHLWRDTGARGRARRITVVAGTIALAMLEARGARAYLAEWRDTETLFRHMAAVTPRVARVHDMLGNVLLSGGREDEARASYERAIALDPAFPAARTNLGNILYMRGDVAGAREQWRLALAADSTFANAHADVGIALAHEGRDDEAERALMRALALNPRQPYAANQLGLLRYREGDVAGARRWFETAIRSKPGFADAHLNLALLTMQAGDAAGAAGHLAVAERHRNSPGLALGIANAWLELRRPADAARLYPEVVAALPRDSTARNNYVVALNQLGRLDEARREALRVLETAPHYADARMNLAFTLERMGDRDGAIAQYRAILDADPGHAGARERLAKVLAAPAPR